VRRNSLDSRGPTPTQENGLADSSNPTPADSHSSISVVTHTSGRYGEVQSASGIRCRDYDGMLVELFFFDPCVLLLLLLLSYNRKFGKITFFCGVGKGLRKIITLCFKIVLKLYNAL
jgi:hypothetical protein